MRKGAKDWTGIENENWIVHKIGRYCRKQRKNLWWIECKHCGSLKERRTFCVTRSKSCGCQNPPPVNKGIHKLEDSDRVTGYWLLRKPWAEGAILEASA